MDNANYNYDNTTRKYQARSKPVQKVVKIERQQSTRHVKNLIPDSEVFQNWGDSERSETGSDT